MGTKAATIAVGLALIRFGLDGLDSNVTDGGQFAAARARVEAARARAATSPPLATADWQAVIDQLEMELAEVHQSKKTSSRCNISSTKSKGSSCSNSSPSRRCRG